VIGVGYLGSLHARKYAELDDVRLECVYDVDPDRAAAVAAETGCATVPSLDRLLERVGAVSIAVPTVCHEDVGCRVAAAGVPMLMEKPLAADAAAGRRLAAAARAAGVLVQVGHLERFNPVFDEIRRVLGRPRFVECHRLSPFAGRGTDTNVVSDVMIHDLDILAYLVGREVATVEAVGVPVLSSQVDIANARIRFEGGCIANVTASRVSLKRERKMRIFQEDAYVSIDFDARTALIARRPPGPVAETAVATTDPMSAISVEQRSFGEGDPLREQIRSFVACVRGGSSPLVGLDEALGALEIADRVIAALEVP